MPRQKSDVEYKDSSVSGVEPELIDAAKDLARQQKRWPRDVFTDALYDYIGALNAGEPVNRTTSPTSVEKRPYHIRLSVDTLTDLRDACERYAVEKSIFFRIALIRYLIAHGFKFSI